MDNLQGIDIPLVMLSRHLPEEYAAVRAREIAPHPKDLIVHRIREVIRMYANACRSCPVVLVRIVLLCL
jgi:D-tagatose-1,6-bisphosphate aldolase subunit GatZ/KbaZ